MGVITLGSTNRTLATATTVNITNPSSTAGDLLIAAINCPVATATINPPSSQGWVSIGSSPTSGNSGNALYLFRRFVGATSEPANFTFTNASTADAVGGTITALRGADPTTPINGSAFLNITNGSLFPSPTSSLTPSVLGCFPMAFFGTQAAYTGAGSALSGTTEISNNYSTNPTYGCTSVDYLALTTDTTTAITGTYQWNTFSDTHGYSVLLLVQPSVPGNITFTPSSITIPNPGATTTVTVAQSGANSVITLSSSNTGVFTVSPSSGNAPSFTATLTGVAAGTATLNAAGS